MNFKNSVSFEDESPTMDAALQVIKNSFFEEIPLPRYNMPHWAATFQWKSEYYNISGDQEVDDPRDLHILYSQGNHNIGGPKIESTNFVMSLKTRKINIGLKENHKFANIGDYWDDETVGKIIDLLHENQVLFPTKFS